MINQISELQMWHALVQKFVSETAIIDDEQVFIYANGFMKVPVYDAASVLSMMNTNPHLLQDVYRQWERGEDSIERAFCTSLYNQMQLEIELNEDVALQAVRDSMSKLFVGGALLGLIDHLLAEGFEVMTFDPQQPVQQPFYETKEPVLQNALFSALKK